MVSLDHGSRESFHHCSTPPRSPRTTRYGCLKAPLHGRWGGVCTGVSTPPEICSSALTPKAHSGMESTRARESRGWGTGIPKVIPDLRHTKQPSHATRFASNNEPGKPTINVTRGGNHDPFDLHIESTFTDILASDVGELLQGAGLWIHGHVHHSFDYQVGRCRVVANPAGYVMNRRFIWRMEEAVLENAQFNPSLVVEV